MLDFFLENLYHNKRNIPFIFKVSANVQKSGENKNEKKNRENFYKFGFGIELWGGELGVYAA